MSGVEASSIGFDRRVYIDFVLRTKEYIYGHKTVRIVDTVTLDAIQNADPVEGLSASLRSGDTRFLGVHGFTSDVPGVSRRPDALKIFGVCWISETSDTASRRQMEEGIRYAEMYNLLLLRHMIEMGKIGFDEPTD